jgi:hypothetical protein
MAGPTAAFPFIEVKIVPPPPPLAQRSPGVIAVVGKAPANNNGGEAPANTPMRIETLDDAVTNFARLQVGSVVRNALYDSLGLEPALPADPIGGNLPGQPMDLLEVKARRRSAKSRPGPATSQGQERHPGRRGRRPRDVGGPGRGHPQAPGRPGGDDLSAAGGAPLGDEGPHPGRQSTPRPADRAPGSCGRGCGSCGAATWSRQPSG